MLVCTVTHAHAHTTAMLVVECMGAYGKDSCCQGNQTPAESEVRVQEEAIARG